MTAAPAPAFDLPGWEHIYSGKVRDLYRPSGRTDGPLLVVASDRVSAFDHVLEPGIPGKGALLTALSRWWFAQLDVPNHLVSPASAGIEMPSAVADRAMLVQPLEMFPIECVVRGYLTGSGWKEYQTTGAVCGIPIVPGLKNGDRLPKPIYTPAWKAPMGEHDENISYERTVELVGAEVAETLRDLSLSVFERASAIAEARGVILADTKFEFGRDSDGVIRLADEVLTSDSSRFWDAQGYDSGVRDQSFDKQIVRDWLAANWDQTGTPPALPEAIVERTSARYAELIDRLTSA